MLIITIWLYVVGLISLFQYQYDYEIIDVKAIILLIFWPITLPLILIAHWIQR